MKLTKYRVLLIWAAVALVLSNVSSSGAQTKEKAPIKIGIAFDLSGGFAADGEAELPAVKMFFEEKGMKVAGRRIELIVEDAATSPSVTLTKVKKLVDMDRVHLVILGQDSASGYAVRDFVHQNGVPTVALAMGAAHTRARYSPFFFRVTPSTYQYSYEPAKWWFNYGFKKIIYLANDIVPAREALEAYKKGLEEMGGEIVQVLWVPVGNTDFGPFIPQLKTDKADAIFVRIWGASAVRFIKQWVEYGKKGTIPLIGGGSTLDEGVSLPAMGLSAEGVFSSSYACPNTDVPENKRLVNGYKSRTGKMPSFLAYFAYMASQAAYEALDKINGEAENKDKLVTSLKNVRFTTPLGAKAYFDERNGMAVDMIFMQAKRTNGEVHLFEIGRIREVKDPVKLFP